MSRYEKTRVPSAFGLHLVNRMGTGYTPAQLTELDAAGGPLRWFDRQLDPESVARDATESKLDLWFPHLQKPAAVKRLDQTSGARRYTQYALDLESRTLLRRVYSTTPVREAMTDFWANHLHIPSVNSVAWIHRAGYEDMLRQHALGSFEELLIAATLHPAMLLYLDTYVSTAKSPNENHARELLELHTLGVGAGYTEEMVVSAAKILSGNTIDTTLTWDATYDTSRHAVGPVRVLGFRSENAAPDGQDLTVALLRYLARHPATSRTVARRLAIRFVSDDPSADLVALLARVYRRNGTRIAPVLRALVRTEEFRASAGRKVRMPAEDLVATVRALDVQVGPPLLATDYGNVIGSTLAAEHLYTWPRPDGAPEDGWSQASAARLVASFAMHWGHALGTFAQGGVTYHPTSDWLPVPELRFDQFVDHLARTFHGRPANVRTLRAAVVATGVAPDDRVNADHPLITTYGHRLIAVLLDHPRHLTR
jgi:uncharacterized protein (DUF1800 family)